MPLKINAGLSRKIGEANYGSRGASVHLELELDSGLIAEPAKFQEKIRQLFNLVRTSLAEELNGHGQSQAKPTQPNGKPAAPADSTERPATKSQLKAIFAIAKQHQRNVPEMIKELFQLRRADDLSLKQASQLIDELKNGRNGG